MTGTPLKAARLQANPLQRFLGSDGSVLNREVIAVGNSIESEWLEVAMAGDEVAEDEGRMHLFPVDDGKYCLQLCYLQYNDPASTTATICSLKFFPGFFELFPAGALAATAPFSGDASSEQQFTVGPQTRMMLGELETGLAKEVTFQRSLQLLEITARLLRSALNSLTSPITDSQVPACRFLAYESEREKIQEAKNIIEQNLDTPHTIRELSRKVAMNECYLKKGFKSLVGKTIHEYQQELRIARARDLLQHQGLSVTEVANILGFSSISHFSTAFKRVTGMKPCELLS